MKKMNNNGFAIAGMLYTLLLIFLVLIFTFMSMLYSRKNLLDQIKKDAINNLNGIIEDTVYIDLDDLPGSIKKGESYSLPSNFINTETDYQNVTCVTQDGNVVVDTAYLNSIGKYNITCTIVASNGKTDEVSKDLIVYATNNLVRNGYLESEDNTNFNSPVFTYVDDDEPYLIAPGLGAGGVSSEFIEVDPSKTYFQSIDAKTTNTSINYIGLREYDVDKNLIVPYQFMFTAGTTTYLTESLEYGESVVHLNDVSNFVQSTRIYQNGLIFWDYTDSTGYTYPKETYSRYAYLNMYDKEDIDYENNTITLNSAWTGATKASGTYLSQSNSGNYYNYGLASSEMVTTSWQTFTNTISGISLREYDKSKFRPGTKYIKVMTIGDYNKIGDSNLYIKNIIFKELNDDNLITNGDLSSANNTNFSSFIYGDGSLVYSTNSRADLTSDEYISINPTHTYLESMDIKANNTTSTHYAGLIEYDIDKNHIQSYNKLYVQNTLTYLTEDLNNGDTVVHLSDVSNFIQSTDIYKNGFIIWNYQDSTGYIYPALTYSRNVYPSIYTYESIDKENNTITLNSPWTGGNLVAGTQLSQSSDGTDYNYGLMSSETLTNTWNTKTSTISGISNETGHTTFSFATRYVKFLMRANYNNTADTTVSIKNLSLKDITE